MADEKEIEDIQPRALKALDQRLVIKERTLAAEVE